MKNSALLLIGFAWMITPAESRSRCYSCTSSVSWDDCERKQMRRGCPVDSDVCVTASVRVTSDNRDVTAYFKTCTTRDRCNASSVAACNVEGTDKSVECSIHCCYGLYCNFKYEEVTTENSQSFKRAELAFPCRPPCLIYSTDTDIRGLELLTPSGITARHAIGLSRRGPVVGFQGQKKIRALDVHVEKMLVFWSDVGDKVIKRGNLITGEVVKVVSDVQAQHDGVAVDWATGLLYWTNRDKKAIEVAKLDGSFRKTLIKDNLVGPKGIVVDPRTGLMFWTDKGTPKIERATLAGRDRISLVTTALKRPEGLVNDYASNRLYWCDPILDYIESIDYDGGNRRVLYKNGVHPFDMAIYGHMLIWSDLGINTVERVDMRTGVKLSTLVTLKDNWATGIAVLHLSRQPIVASPCGDNNGGCSHLCLPNGDAKYICACPDGDSISADQKNCNSVAPSVNPRKTTIATTTSSPTQTTTKAAASTKTQSQTPTTAKTQAPSTTMSTESPSTTMSAESPSTTMSTESPSTTMSTESPSTTMSTESPSTKMSTESPSTTMSTESPSTTMSTESSSTKISTGSPSTRMSTESPFTTMSTGSPSTRMSTESPTTTMSTESPTTTMSTESPSTTISSESPSSTMWTESPSTTMSTESPFSRMSTKSPSTTMSTESPFSRMSTESPFSRMSTESPSTTMSTESPSTTMSTESPFSRMSTGSPSTTMSTESPFSRMSTESPSTTMSTESPFSRMSTESPTPAFPGTFHLCEHSSATLSCDQGKRLSIISANYGRTFDQRICPHYAMRTTHCQSAYARDVIHCACHSRRSCRLYAKNEVYGDPCPGTFKYIEVRYSCV